MRLKRLKLTGFKSFVEPTELRIEPGLTGVVGPNGCGKSNLLEALRWVMGESSPKSMRGGGMEDVIFAGTAARPARDFAEVSLLADIAADENLPNFVANDDDLELEVTRRIERGAGSAYRANGNDVRAKDVALIFADAATGAHSPALVSQGRIGSIISAKPAERRQMLEEAAGISGLHVRRKDAEQKLRAAENNLEKLSVILGDMEARAAQLKRQARQAERYRKLTNQIEQAEARLVYVRWKEAKASADAAKSEAAQAGEAVAKAKQQQESLSAELQAATEKLARDRAAAMAARDASSELSGRIIKLNAERDRIIQRIADLEAQAQRIAEDGSREDKLTHDAAEALERLKSERKQLSSSIESSEAERPALESAHKRAEEALRENELALARARAEAAKADAEQRVAHSSLAQARSMLERAENELERLRKEKAALGEESEFCAAVEQAEAESAEQERKSETSAAAIAEIETGRQEALAQREAAQNRLAKARADHAALVAERDALQRALQKNTSAGQNESAIARMAVEEGYEHALASALGEDADAAIGGDAPRRWEGAAASYSGQPDRLSAYVDAPDELRARLDAVIVLDSDDGRPLARGERLVTRDGRLRRWDGFISEDDGATHAEALLRANRLKEIEKRLPQLEKAVDEAAAQHSAQEGALSQLQARKQEAEQARSDADTALRESLRAVDRHRDALERLRKAGESLALRIAETEQEREAAQAEHAKAEAAVGDLPDASAQTALARNLEEEAEALRQALLRAQAELSALEQTLGQQRERRAVADAEIRSWQDRAGEAEKRISAMKARAGEIAAEKAELDGKPSILTSELEALETEREGLGERLEALQQTEAESEAAQRDLESRIAEASEAHSVAREARAGAEARAENQEARRIEMGRISGERFECQPQDLPEKLDFDDASLDEATQESARLESLQASRERIGPVNLIAADELEELESEQAKGTAESEELTQAINRLRGSIGSLNREGRVRLVEAFEAVDQHFRRLFTTLFDGGKAHLALIDSDDPLEAGLEIYAQPPGKKLQSLTLLSGGEQALTAVALIFALFLTNPAPICVLDEVDAPLDDANIERFCNLLDMMHRETDTRYLIVTHNAVTMSRMHRLFGVTMIEHGVSRLVSVDLDDAEELIAAE